MPALVTFAVAEMAMVLSPVWTAHFHAAEATAVASASDSPAEIAQDNALMQSVNLALGANEPSPLDEFNLSAGAGSPAAALSASARTR